MGRSQCSSQRERKFVQPPAPANDEPGQNHETDDNQDADPEPQELPPLQRSRCLCQPVDRLTYAMMAELTHTSPDCEGELFCLKALFPDVLVYAAYKDPDTMYLHQAMKEPNKDKFIAAMVEEMDAQLKGGRQLLTDPQVQGFEGHHHTPSGLANEAQAPDPSSESLQVEGLPEH